jgi:cardiolipin synthase
MTSIFEADLADSVMIDSADWEKRPLYKQLPEKLARLLSPLL